MDPPNSSLDQEKQREQQSSELPILNDKDNTLESSDPVPSLVSETIRLQMLWLTAAALSLARGRKSKTYLGYRALSTHPECASRR
jgi:hypothetical protein